MLNVSWIHPAGTLPVSPAKGPSRFSARVLSVTDVVDLLLRLRIAALVEEKSILLEVQSAVCEDG